MARTRLEQHAIDHSTSRHMEALDIAPPFDPQASIARYRVFIPSSDASKALQLTFVCADSEGYVNGGRLPAVADGVIDGASAEDVDVSEVYRLRGQDPPNVPVVEQPPANHAASSKEQLGNSEIRTAPAADSANTPNDGDVRATNSTTTTTSTTTTAQPTSNRYIKYTQPIHVDSVATREMVTVACVWESSRQRMRQYEVVLDIQVAVALSEVSLSVAADCQRIDISECNAGLAARALASCRRLESDITANERRLQEDDAALDFSEMADSLATTQLACHHARTFEGSEAAALALGSEPDDTDLGTVKWLFECPCECVRQSCWLRVVCVEPGDSSFLRPHDV